MNISFEESLNASIDSTNNDNKHKFNNNLFFDNSKIVTTNILTKKVKRYIVTIIKESFSNSSVKDN